VTTPGNRRRALAACLVAVVVGAVALAGCEAPSGAIAGSAEADQTQGQSELPSSSAPGVSSALSCSPDSLTTKVEHELTFATSTPAEPPYFEDNNPGNGKGFESALAYALAHQLGFHDTDVVWDTVAASDLTSSASQPFDIGIGQLPITVAAARSVDFSHAYYLVNQSVLARTGGPAAAVRTTAGLRTLRLGARAASAGMATIRRDVRPSRAPRAYPSVAAAERALQAGRVDAVVVDLPTAFALASAGSGLVVTGSFPTPETGTQWGMTLERDSPILACVDQALDALATSGRLAAITQRWLGRGAGLAAFS